MKKSIFPFVIVSVISACGAKPPHFGADTVIDCAKQDVGAMASLALKLQPLLYGERPDWPAIRHEAEVFGVAVGGCVLSDIVNQYLSHTRAIEDSHEAWDTLEDFRKSQGGNVTWNVRGQNI